MCLTQGASASPCACLSRTVVMSAESVAPCPLTVRLVTSDSAVELLEHVGGTQLLATVPQPPVTHGDRQNGRTVGREGRRGVVSAGKRAVPGDTQAKGAASLTGVCAAQGGEARQGPGQGELPASLMGSL
jgi:hypothetical protein